MSIHNLLSRRNVLLALCCVLVAAALIGYYVPTSDALPPNEVWREYYSDSSYTNLVGERWLFCNGASGGWGIITSYRITYTFPCW